MYYNSKKLEEIANGFTYGELKTIKSPLFKELRERFSDLHKACQEVLDLNIELNQARDAARLGAADRIRCYSIVRARLTLKCWTELQLKVDDQPLYHTLQKLKAHSQQLLSINHYPDSTVLKQNVLCAVELCHFARSLCSESSANTDKLYPYGDKVIEEEFQKALAVIVDHDEEKATIRERVKRQNQIWFGEPGSIAYQQKVEMKNMGATVDVSAPTAEQVKSVVASISRMDKRQAKGK